jgi:hypothetical protein
MIDTILKVASKLWPWPIYKGISSTTDDLVKEYQTKFNRRICRTTAKFQMHSKYSVYDLVNTTTDLKTKDTLYKLEHCATGNVMTVNESTFKELFTRYRNEVIHES